VTLDRLTQNQSAEQGYRRWAESLSKDNRGAKTLKLMGGVLTNAKIKRDRPFDLPLSRQFYVFEMRLKQLITQCLAHVLNRFDSLKTNH
jgi:hypothetical protein